MPPDFGYLAPNSAKVNAPQKLAMPPSIQGNNAHHTLGICLIVFAGVTNIPEPMLDPMAILHKPIKVNFFSRFTAIAINISTTIRNSD
jgi:hypothetical protein